MTNLLPDPIVKITKQGEAITLEAISGTSYEKCYFNDYTVGKTLVNPRKTKIVNLRSNQYPTVKEYFRHLIKDEGYIIIPQNRS